MEDNQTTTATEASSATPGDGSALPKRKRISPSTIVVALILIVGIGFMAYPTISDWWNSMTASRAISNYTAVVDEMTPEQIAAMRAEAVEYNEQLATVNQNFNAPVKLDREYESVLNVDGRGMMSFLQIPSINVELPIYHTTREQVLQVACGHLEGTSMPVGGPSTHCVVTGHRGLPSAVLLSNMDKLSEGDLFMLNTLDETLTYEVDQIRIVEPQETNDLMIVPGEDLCTLVTCTPYGINSHRMLVRGHRVPNSNPLNITGEAEQISPILVASAVGIPLMFVVLAIAMFMTRKRNKRNVAFDTLSAQRKSDKP